MEKCCSSSSSSCLLKLPDVASHHVATTASYSMQQQGSAVQPFVIEHATSDNTVMLSEGSAMHGLC